MHCWQHLCGADLASRLPTHCPASHNASPHHSPLPSSKPFQKLQSVRPATAVQRVLPAPLARSRPVALGRPASNAWVKATPSRTRPSARCASTGNTPTPQKLPASATDCADYVSSALPAAAFFDSDSAAFAFQIGLLQAPEQPPPVLSQWALLHSACPTSSQNTC